MGESTALKKELANLYTDNNLYDTKLGESYKNLGDQVYEIIKNKIVCHKIKPGERIIDKHFADKLGVSRSLVRQVFNILEKEELITLVPRNGFYVREMTKKDIEEIYDIRNLLETHATKLAVPRISDEDIGKIKEVFEEAKRKLKEDKVKKFVEADASLHQMLHNNCGNDRLKKMIDKYSNHYIFYRLIDLSRVERAKESYYEHYKIFKAVKDRNVKLATELMRKHIENAKNIILDNFDQYTYG